MLLWVGVGLALGAGFLRYATAADAARERRVIAVGLVVAALVYVAFAAVGGAGPVGLEALGVVVFAVPAYAGWRRSSLYLAAGWIAHVGWDVGLHMAGPGYGPEWYAALCIGFDLLVAGRVLWTVIGGTRIEGDNVVGAT